MVRDCVRHALCGATTAAREAVVDAWRDVSMRTPAMLPVVEVRTSRVAVVNGVLKPARNGRSYSLCFAFGWLPTIKSFDCPPTLYKRGDPKTIHTQNRCGLYSVELCTSNQRNRVSDHFSAISNEDDSVSDTQPRKPQFGHWFIQLARVASMDWL